jgi:hypothetical protein
MKDKVTGANRYMKNAAPYDEELRGCGPTDPNTSATEAFTSAKVNAVTICPGSVSHQSSPSLSREQERE